MVYPSLNDRHVHELWWDGGWNGHDLSSDTGAPAADGRVHGYVFDLGGGQQHLVYGSTDGRLVELARSGRSWRWYDLTTSGAPVPFGDPAGYAWDAEGSQHVIVRDSDWNVWEVYWIAGGWHVGSLTAAIGGSRAQTDPVAFMFPDLATEHVLYAGVDRHLWSLSWGAGGAGRSGEDVTALSAAASGSEPNYLGAHPVGGCAFPAASGKPTPTVEVLAVGIDNGLYHYRWDGGWQPAEPLSGPLELPRLAGAVDLVADVAHSALHGFVLDADGMLHHLVWRP